MPRQLLTPACPPWHAGSRGPSVPEAWTSSVCPDRVVGALGEGAPSPLLFPLSPSSTHLVIAPTYTSALLRLQVGRRGIDGRDMGPGWGW